MKKLFKLLFSRLFVVGVLLLAQIALVVYMIETINSGSRVFYMLFQLASAAVVIMIVSRNMNPQFKIAWMLPIIFLPVFGVILYIIFGNRTIGRRQMKKIAGIDDELNRAKPDDSPIFDRLSADNSDAARQADYLRSFADAPVWQNTRATYLKSGEVKFESLLSNLKKAKKYIFLEYFIIEPGVMWDAILDVLRQKAADGLDVRVIYDDFGCIQKLPSQYYKTLRQYGIKSYAFNRFVPVLDVRFNNRDHRKIAIIDGHIGYCGGINLADEYINEIHPFGYWKDTAVLLEGYAVYSLSVMFLTLWSAVSKDSCDYSRYLQDSKMGENRSDGYVIPYGDYPYDRETVGENVYLNLISRAKKYIHICTPYLVIDNEMRTALCIAAKSGVEVVIATPGIPDKAYVYTVTRSNYKALIDCGVKIYEYTPGFLHSKSFIVDGIYATVGTINLDYRSFYFHLECGVWMYKSSCIEDMEADFEQLLSVSTPPTEKIIHPNAFYRAGRVIMNLISPMM